MRSFAVLAVALCLSAPALAAIEADEITSLPGWSAALPSKQYSGYLGVGGTKALHYWMVESIDKDPTADTTPVLLWLNGGPGCSSLDGYLYEQGPFHVNESDHTQLYFNEYTWAKEVIIIFLEAPAGVGFSFASSPSAYTFNDTVTAHDNWEALKAFFKGFPEYASRDFYIAGESYAGVYVPTLAARVLEGNKAGDSNINLKGIMVGNGCTGNDVGICGGKGTKFEKDFLAGHSLVEPKLSAELDAACGDYLNPSAQCEELLAEMSAAIGDVNIYDVYSPCINGNGGTANRRDRARSANVNNLGGPDGCIDGIAAGTWLNTDVVQDALHVSPARKYFGKWTICSSKIEYHETASNLPKNVYPDLVENLHVLIFNGDVDACVPWLDNEAWTTGMGYTAKKPWHPWTIDDQVAGYATVYDTTGPAPFTFITVKGSGHMVPEYRPAPALEMLKRYLAGTEF